MCQELDVQLGWSIVYSVTRRVGLRQTLSGYEAVTSKLLTPIMGLSFYRTFWT